MSDQAYTLAMYRAKPGQEAEFIARWNALAATFSSLPAPPLWGTLIRHRTDRTLFYSFGPWSDAKHVQAMRQNAKAVEAFQQLREVCSEMVPGDYEVVVHVDVQAGKPAAVAR
jgi:hypothetical protein